MTTLVLVRHAKSDWGDPGLDDHDRPLNSRGLRDAPAAARRLAATGLRLDALLSSTALRARTTAGFFGAALGLEPELDPDLYGAPAAKLLSAAGARGRAGADGVVIVAHDPGMTVLAEHLSGGAIGHMPTCAVATFQWETPDWDVATATDPDSWSFDAPGHAR
ncbi:SixA phosphatase family protein [Microbacterium aurum]|mgnify:FL=1